MTTLMGDNPKSPLNAALIFFAIVGFLASAVTVVQFFRPAEISRLEVEIYPSEFRTPKYPAGPLQSGEQARLIVTDIRSNVCAGLAEDTIIKTDRTKLAALSSDKKEQEKMETCKDWTEIEFAARWLGEYSESDGEMLRYQITNTGRKVAEDIRIRATSLNSLQYKIGNDYVEAKRDSEEEYYYIPNLNPNEAVAVLAWTNTLPTNLSYSEWDDFPPVTFAGSEVHTELFKPVNDGWYEIYEFLSDAPVVISGAFLIVASFLIVLLTWLAIAIPIALITGKPLADLFVEKKKNEDTPGDGASEPDALS